MMLPPMMTGVSTGPAGTCPDVASVPSGFSPLALGWPVGFVALFPNPLEPIMELLELPLPKDDLPNDEFPKLEEEPPNDELPKLDEEPPNEELPKLEEDEASDDAGTPGPPVLRIFKLPMSWPLGPT